jgi:hypothetical protein
VHLTFSSAEAEEEWERDLMANNEKEATRLRTLLQGEMLKTSHFSSERGEG